MISGTEISKQSDSQETNLDSAKHHKQKICICTSNYYHFILPSFKLEATPCSVRALNL